MSNYYNIQIFFVLIILNYLFVSSKDANNFRQLESTSKIALKVNEIGMQSILNKSFRPLPNKILVNGKEIDMVDSQINVTDTNSVIELFWNETITNCSEMFAEMSNISEINFTDFDTSKVTDMSNMFMNCKSLKELDLSSFDTSNVMDMSKMFYNCINLNNLHINNFKTEKVTNMERMFEYCMSLENLDMHNFNTLSVTNMDYMFHFCSNLKNLDLSKFNTSAVTSMMAMFASCISLDTLNLSFFDFSNTINSSYMLFDTSLMILDLTNFKGESIIFSDDILKFNPNLKYIGLQNYNGKDIFKNLEADSDTIICADNDTTKFESNLLSLKEKNVTNNCSDYCFSEFRKIKEDKRGCEIDCAKIENDTTNIYYYLCYKDIESSIISDSDNFEETISVSTDISNIESTIISDSVTNTQTILADTTNIEETITSETTNLEKIISDSITNKQTILPDTTNVEKEITTDTNTIKQTILADTTNVEKTITTDTNSIKQTILHDTTNIEKTIPGTSNIKTTILHDTTNIEKTIPNTTNIKTTILPDTTNIEKTIPNTSNIKTTIVHNATTNNEPSSSPQASNIEPPILTNTISTTDITNPMSSKYIILLYGYDSYFFQYNIIRFSIYFLINGGFSYPKYIFFTINIIFEYIVRNLAEQSNQNVTCSLESEEKLVKYNCASNPLEKMDINNITVNYDFNFSHPYELVVIPFAQYNKDKITNQTDNFISTKELIILYGNLTQEDDYFKVKGKLDSNTQLDNHFNLTVYSNTSELIQVLCEATNEEFDNYEIKCAKDKSVNFNINNSISFMESKQLLVIVDGEEKVLVKGQNNSKNNLAHNIYSKKNNTSLSPGIIALIVIVIVVVCVITGLMTIFRKKLFKNRSIFSHSKEYSETYVDLKASNINKTE